MSSSRSLRSTAWSGPCMMQRGPWTTGRAFGIMGRGPRGFLRPPFHRREARGQRERGRDRARRDWESRRDSWRTRFCGARGRYIPTKLFHYYANALLFLLTCSSITSKLLRKYSLFLRKCSTITSSAVRFGEQERQLAHALLWRAREVHTHKTVHHHRLFILQNHSFIIDYLSCKTIHSLFIIYPAKLFIWYL